MGLFSFIKSCFKSSENSKEATQPEEKATPETNENEESYAMDSDAGHIVQIADLPMKSDSSVLDSRWPPFPRAVQVLSPKHLIDAQAELVRNLCSAIPLSDEEVERYLMPVVWNLACFVHLLPASAHHHHRGLGGLFGHSLETAIFAAQTAKNKIFDYKAKPEDAYMNKARWILACALAGLTHDVGKAVLDIRVYSDKGTWHPTTGSITEWCRAKGITAYYVAMNEEREHNKHEQASLAYARVIIPRRTYLYLSQTGNSKIEEELHAAINGQREGCLVGEILGEADQLSVKLDERRQGTIDPRDKLVTTPLADAIVKAMRSLIKEGTWKINCKDATIWLTTQGCFVDWSDVSDITKVLAVEGVKSVPHDNSAMASMLLTEGLIEAAPGTISPDERFWLVCPLLLKERTVTCIKFRVPIRLIGSVTAYTAMPVYLPGLPMLEADAKAWVDSHGFDPSSQENQQVEEEDYLNQLMENYQATPGAYETPNVGFYTKDEDGNVVSIVDLLPPDTPNLDEFNDPSLDEPDMVDEEVEALENQLLQSDFYLDEDEREQNQPETVAEIPAGEEANSVNSHLVEVSVSAYVENNCREKDVSPLQSSQSEDVNPTKNNGSTSLHSHQKNPAVIVDAAPTLKVKQEIKQVETSQRTPDDQPIYVKAEDVDVPEAPEEYKKLDVSEDSFALLLPGGVRKKRRHKREDPVKSNDAPSSIEPATPAFTPAPLSSHNDSNPTMTRSEENVHNTTSVSAVEEDEFGGMVVEEEVPVESYESVPIEEDMGLAISIDDDPVEVEEPDVVSQPSSPAKGKRTETVEGQDSTPKQEEKVMLLSSPTIDRIAAKCGSNHRQAAKELMNEMKTQILNRRGDLLSSQVWKNIVGFVTEDKGFKAALDALHIPVPVMAMELMKYQPSPTLEWDRTSGKIHLKVEKKKA